MVRKQVYVEPRQERLLKRRAKELGVTEAELIRRSIDAAAATALLLPRRKEAWKKTVEFVRRYRSMNVPQTGRRWTRDELYQDRLERFSR